MSRILASFAAVALALASVLAGPVASAPVGTAFTYQGRLQENGAAATGQYDFEFKLYDALTAGTQLAALTRTNVSVTAGLFTASLDFEAPGGPATFDGSARWLQVGVRPGGTSDPFTTLTPRQELTPTPNASYSAKAGSAFTLGGIACAAGQIPKWSGTAWTCALDTLGSLSCNTGDVPQWNGTAWTCVPAPPGPPGPPGVSILIQNQPAAICDKTVNALGKLGRDDIYITPPTWFYDGGGCC